MTEGSEGDIFDQAITRREAQMLLPMSLFPSFSLFLFIFLFFLLLSPERERDAHYGGAREG